MFRKLSAIEIAEGALLSDVAVIFQLLSVYLPIGGHVFRLLIFVVFAILVLRRGLYVGIMGMFVSFFITSVVIGPQFLSLMLLEASGGLFLGVTMRHRWRHAVLLLLGITGGAFVLYCQLLLLFVLTGLPLSDLIRPMHAAYTATIGFVGLLTANVGLGGWWKQSIYPPVAALAAFAFTYWLGLFYVALWIVLCPIVTIIYAATNILARLLGYDVRPFPDGRLNKFVLRVMRSLLKFGLRRGIIKRYDVKAEKA